MNRKLAVEVSALTCEVVFLGYPRCQYRGKGKQPEPKLRARRYAEPYTEFRITSRWRCESLRG
jgi:hypothetical protein